MDTTGSVGQDIVYVEFDVVKRITLRVTISEALVLSTPHAEGDRVTEGTTVDQFVFSLNHVRPLHHVHPLNYVHTLH